MTKEQLKRANQAALPLILVIMGYIVVSMGGSIFAGGGNWHATLQFVMAIISIITSVIGFAICWH